MVMSAGDLTTDPLADYEAHAGSGSVGQLHQGHQVLVVDHMICRSHRGGKKNVASGAAINLFQADSFLPSNCSAERLLGEQYCPR